MALKTLFFFFFPTFSWPLIAFMIKCAQKMRTVLFSFYDNESLSVFLAIGEHSTKNERSQLLYYIYLYKKA